MHIEETLRLDFKDVLIRPKRSTLTSRAQVDLNREFVFHHSGKTYNGIPIIAANMDSTGTIEMARALEGHQLSVALHKHYDEDTLVSYFSTLEKNRPRFIRWALHKLTLKNFQLSWHAQKMRLNTSASMWRMAIPKVSLISLKRYAPPTLI
jgi:GMP reductase